MTDNLDFDQILTICLDRLQAGDTIADCLASYPQHAAQLAPLLRVAGVLQTPAGPAMSVEGLRAGEARLLAHAATLRRRRKGTTFSLTRITRRLATVSVVGALLVGGVLSVGTVSAAAASLPGSRLYPVKQATEIVVSWAAFTPQLKTTVHLAWADRRLREAEALLARDGTSDESVLAAMEQETEQALAAAEQAGPEQLTAVAAQTDHQQTTLRAVLDKAPPAARPGLERALSASAKDHARAHSALDQVAPGKPDKDHPRGTPPGQVGKDQPNKEEQPVTAPPPPGVTDSLDTASGAEDELHQPDDDQGETPTPDEDAGQGQGQGQGHDQNPGQGHGQGKDKGEDNSQGHGQGKPK